ncbi:cadherin-like domain-containing protein [Ectothiorhodospiraceae bacterium WFHF3C12]|nr:cadherin-like domain-containing protein [Ectothiorhodospiraceae bacterium WFHF3C12]
MKALSQAIPMEIRRLATPAVLFALLLSGCGGGGGGGDGGGNGAVEDAPSAVEDSVSINEDAGATTIDVLDNDSFGTDGPGSVALALSSAPGNGTATIDDGGTPSAPADDTIEYTPDPDYNGMENFTYVIEDADGDSAVGTVTVTVSSVNDTPAAGDDALTVEENDNATTVNVLGNDDFGGDGPGSSAITVSTPPGNGSATINDGGTPDDPTDDSIAYAPAADYSGADSFEYTIEDADGDQASGTVTVTVQPTFAWYLLLSPTTTVNSQTVTPVDVLAYEPESSDLQILSTINVTPAGVDAYERVNDSRYYFSLDQHANLGGTVAAPGDVVLYDSGTYSLALDASAAGLSDGVDVDAVTVSGNGDLIFSTSIHFSAGGTSFSDADLVRYDGSTFSLFLAAAALGLDDGADVDAVTLRDADTIALSTRTGGSASGVAFGNGEVLLADTASGIGQRAVDTESALGTTADVTALSDNR